MRMCSFTFEIAQALTGTPPLHLTISYMFDNHRGVPFYNKKSLLTHREDDVIILVIQQGGQEWYGSIVGLLFKTLMYMLLYVR